jgi:hypothetical protein
MDARTRKGDSMAARKSTSTKRTKSADGLSADARKAYFGAPNAASAARAIGLDGKTQFRPIARRVIGHQRDAAGWGAYWSTTNAQRVLDACAKVLAKKAGK